MIYLKFDFSDSELEKFPELKKHHDSLYCIRTTLIAFGESSSTHPTGQTPTVTLSEDTYSALKVPSLDGEELWIIAKNLKSQFEKQIALKAPLTEIFSFPAEKIKQMQVTHPQLETKLSLKLSSDQNAANLTGCAILGMSFDKKSIDELRQSGHLVFTNIK